jgi:glycosyltransferase involved in cell wall biosynthesis
LKVAVWSPLPPASSEVADHTTDLLPALAEHHEVVAVVDDPAAVDEIAAPDIPVFPATSVPPSDLDVYQIGNSPEHAFIYRAALEHPGVVVLHEWVLHDLVWHEATERDDNFAYLREMRRSHGTTGSLVAQQVSRGRGGKMLPALFAANYRLLESSLGVATLTREAGMRLKLRHPATPHLHLPPHVRLPASALPSRSEARRTLGLPEDALLVTAPGPAASMGLEALVGAVGRLRAEFPSLRLVLAGEIDSALPLGTWVSAADIGDTLLAVRPDSTEDLVRHLVAADVVSMLRFPSRGEMPAALLRAVGVGRPVLVTAGTPGAEEAPEGIVVPVDPGPREEQELVALLRLLLGSERLRDEIGGLARDHAATHHGLDAAAARLARFLVEVEKQRPERLREMRAERVEEGALAEYFVDEIRFTARDLGLHASSLGLEARVVPLAGPRRVTGGEG